MSMTVQLGLQGMAFGAAFHGQERLAEVLRGSYGSDCDASAAADG